MAPQKKISLWEALAIKLDPKVMAEDVILRDLAQERSFYGREAVCDFLSALFHSLAGMQPELRSAVIDRKAVVLAFLLRGYQDRPFMGIPPTLHEVDVPMVMLCKIEAGRIKQADLYYNAGTLLRQLGLG